MLYTFLRWCPGALGLFLRQKLYPRYVKECGPNVLFGRFVELRDGRDSISIGSDVVINDFASLSGCSGKSLDASLVIDDNVFVGTGTMVNITGGNIRIQSGSNIGSACLVRSDQPVLLEKDVLVAAFCEIGKMSHTSEQLPVARRADSDRGQKETKIGQGCWLGVRAKIAAGVQIGEGTIIGAHSTVSADMPDHVVAIGAPAAVLHKRV